MLKINIYMRVPILFSIFFLALLWGCGGPENTTTPPIDTPDFDRSAILKNWADNIIIPSYTTYVQDLGSLNNSTDQFINNPDEQTLLELQNAWKLACISWQYVSMFDIGKAETIGLRNYSNIYPVDIDAIEENITLENYNLELPSTFDQQGLQTIDYLLYQENALTALVNNNARQAYLKNVVTRLQTLATDVLDDWENGYRAAFVTDSGTSATSSINKIVNDYLFYYEKYLRAGKVGIPAGVFSGNVEPERVEGRFSKIFSIIFLEHAFNAFENFFNGKNSNNGGNSNESLAAYLDYLNDLSNTRKLSDIIRKQFNDSNALISLLDENFASNLQTNNLQLLMLFDALQETVIVMKTEMLQTLNIRVDYVDADGD